MSWMDRLYQRSPLLAQHLMVSTYGIYWKWLRLGGNYPALVQGYLARENWPAAVWQQFQQQKLQALLAAAWENVPFYRSNWSADQVKAALQGEYTALPLLEKDSLRQDPLAFCQEDRHPRHLKHFHTSGTTGTPIRTIWTVDEVRDSLAVREARSARWAGVSFSLPRATFSGRMVEPDPASRGPFYRYNAAERQVYLSPFHLRPQTARDYVKALRRHRVQWLTGYAVSYYLLAKMILDQRLPVPPLRAVITTSEKLTPEMRTVMESAYRCRVFEEYSTVENALFASECEHRRLHVSPEVGLVEILRPDGSACAPGEVGEVVATCLMRTYQPLIRYRLGDLAAWDPAPCLCGRAMPVISEVVGRIEDVVVGPDGRQMVRFHGIFVDQPHVLEGQIVQEALDAIRVLVVPGPGFGERDVQDIIHRVHQRLGEKISVSVDQVEQIPRTNSGKFQAVVSKLDSQSS